MPLTSAERCRKYREKLKKENPVKFEEIKRRNAERTKAKKRKISDLTEDEKKEVRQKWREAKKRKIINNEEQETVTKEDQTVTKEDQTVTKEDQTVPSHQTYSQLPKIRAQAERLRRYYRKKVEQNNLILQQKIECMSREISRYRKMVTRSRQTMNLLIADMKELRSYVANQLDSDSTSHKDSDKPSPMTKSNDFVEIELPNISEEAKEKVKQKLLQQHVLEESLKETYKDTKSFQDKRVLKKLMVHDAVKKYNMTGKVSQCLGLKMVGIRKRHSIKQQRLKTAKDLRFFFERDDVSRMTAGKKEYMTYNKTQKQKRFLVDTLLKLYKKYKNEGGKVSFTTFKRYRPFYVVAPNVTGRNTCACMRHSNLALKAEALKKFGVIQTTDLTELISEIVCNIQSKSCMYSECALCTGKKLKYCTRNDQEIFWFEFISKKHEFQDKAGERKITKKVVKERQTGSLNTLAELMQKELNNFKIHHFNISHQYKQYKESIENIEDNEVILHCDFSENYMCKMAEEVQSMHFGASKTQFTLHTGVLYIKNHKPISFCSFSPSLKHGPEAIWGHLKPVTDFVKASFPAINSIHVWSDGPTTQYRQKKNFLLLCEKKNEEGFKQATWSFFEASHGKGAADGVGGAVKRTLDARVAYGDDIVDAKSAFDILSKTETSIKLFYVSEEDIGKITVPNPEKIVPVPSTMKIHQVVATENKHTIKYRALSCFCMRGSCECFALKTHSLIKLAPKRNNTRKSSYNSSEDTDTEVQFAESDLSDWNEAENINSSDLDVHEVEKENRDNIETTQNIPIDIKPRKVLPNKRIIRKDNEIQQSTNILTEIMPTYTTSENVKEKTETKEQGNDLRDNFTDAVINKEKKKSVNSSGTRNTGVKILAEVKNSAENQRFFDIKSYGKFTLTKIGLDFDIYSAAKTSVKQQIVDKENFDGFPINPILSTPRTKSPKQQHVSHINIKPSTSAISCGDLKEISPSNTKKNYDDDDREENINTHIDNHTKDLGELVQDNITKSENELGENDINVEKSDDELDTISNETNILVNDAVLVRYFLRKSWKYYVGFVQNIEIKDEKMYTVTFLKAVKTPTLKFIMPKKVDRDILRRISIVKKIELTQQSKEYYLVNSSDVIFF